MFRLRLILVALRRVHRFLWVLRFRVGIYGAFQLLRDIEYGRLVAHFGVERSGEDGDATFVEHHL